jgi:hypothetical protein
MKKLFTGFVFFFLSSLIAEAQFLSATLPDTYNPLTPNLDSNITTLNCYSHGNTYTAYISYRMRNDGLLMNDFTGSCRSTRIPPYCLPGRHFQDKTMPAPAYMQPMRNL